MPSAWVTRELIELVDGKKFYRREHRKPGLAEVVSGDRYVVEWIDNFRKRHLKRIKQQSGKTPKEAAQRAKKLADTFADQLNSQFTTGTYQDPTQTTWTDFRARFESQHLKNMRPRSAQVAREALNQFEKIIKPVVMDGVSTETIAVFSSKRRDSPGKRKGEKISVASVNKELRHIRATLNIATEWGYLKASIKVRLLKEPKRIPRYITPEHFDALYQACEAARFPQSETYPAADWWRALLVTAYMTGWRISELLSFLRRDLEWGVDKTSGVAILRAENTKGGRDERIDLHPLVLEHINRIPSLETMEPELFRWPHSFRFLYDHFAEIQQAGGISLPCHKKHTHTDSCHVYGFHDLRRAFATLNATRMTPEALQVLMRHKSFTTTLGYINTARQLTKAIENLYVPALPPRSSAAGG